jgi:excinuclease UvrABC nuclease subunit
VCTDLHELLGQLDGLVETNLLYVGKSKNLRRRFLQHLEPHKSHNVALFEVLFSRNAHQQLEFWYLTMPEKDIDAVERKLIREANPSLNVIRYGDENV